MTGQTYLATGNSLSFFNSNMPELSERQRLLKAIAICLEAIQYCERTIVEEISQSAKNKDIHYASYLSFEEVAVIHAYPLKKSLIQETTYDLYAKREVFLELLVTLTGESSKKYRCKYPSSTNPEIKISELNVNLPSSTITFPIRTDLETTALKKRASDFSNTLKTHARRFNSPNVTQKIEMRFKAANTLINQSKLIINKVRDTKPVDSWFWGLIKQLARLFSPTSKIAKKSNELIELIDQKDYCSGINRRATQ